TVRLSTWSNIDPGGMRARKLYGVPAGRFWKVIDQVPSEFTLTEEAGICWKLFCMKPPTGELGGSTGPRAPKPRDTVAPAEGEVMWHEATTNGFGAVFACWLMMVPQKAGSRFVIQGFDHDIPIHRLAPIHKESQPGPEGDFLINRDGFRLLPQQFLGSL